MTPQGLVAPFVERMMRNALRNAFRRVSWVGPLPSLPPNKPVVLYTNHHNFYDGYLAWLAIRTLLQRPTLTWMEEWDRFPFFGAVGALPFPADDPRRRAATFRHTIRSFRKNPETVLIYFPEGRLHPAEDGLLPFDAEAFTRLDRLLPDKVWWPVGIHITWWGDSLPIALLGGGTPYPSSTGEERARLASVWHAIRSAEPQDTYPILDGRHSPHERWNLSFMRPFFKPRT